MRKYNRDFVERKGYEEYVTSNHPLAPKDVAVHGYIMDSRTGLLTQIDEPTAQM